MPRCVKCRLSRDELRAPARVPSLGLWIRAWLSICVAIFSAETASAEQPRPVLNTVFPPGAAVGQTTDVIFAGANLNGLKALLCNAPGVRCVQLESMRFQ